MGHIGARRSQQTLIMFYKVINHLVEVPHSHILVQLVFLIIISLIPSLISTKLAHKSLYIHVFITLKIA